MSARDTSETSMQEIVEAFGSLSPRQRSRLVKRLHVLGLWDPEELLSDRDRLNVAPALGASHLMPQGVPPSAQTRELGSSESPMDESEPSERTTSASTAAEPTKSKQIAKPTREPESQKVSSAASSTGTEEVLTTSSDSGTAQRSSEQSNYRSSVRSSYVVAADREDDIEPSTMAPLPGQAPEEPIGIIFDGGNRGESGRGYASYAIRWPGMPQQIVRLRFANEVTGAEAEYDTLIAALEATLKRLQDHDAAPETAKLDIRGDSHMVLSQVRGDVEIEDPSLRLRCDRVRFLLRRFGSWRLSRYHRSPGAGAPSS